MSSGSSSSNSIGFSGSDAFPLALNPYDEIDLHAAEAVAQFERERFESQPPQPQSQQLTTAPNSNAHSNTSGATASITTESDEKSIAAAPAPAPPAPLRMSRVAGALGVSFGTRHCVGALWTGHTQSVIRYTQMASTVCVCWDQQQQTAAAAASSVASPPTTGSAANNTASNAGGIGSPAPLPASSSVTAASTTGSAANEPLLLVGDDALLHQQTCQASCVAAAAAAAAAGGSGGGGGGANFNPFTALANTTSASGNGAGSGPSAAAVAACTSIWCAKTLLGRSRHAAIGWQSTHGHPLQRQAVTLRTDDAAANSIAAAVSARETAIAAGLTGDAVPPPPPTLIPDETEGYLSVVLSKPRANQTAAPTSNNGSGQPAEKEPDTTASLPLLATGATAGSANAPASAEEDCSLSIEHLSSLLVTALRHSAENPGATVTDVQTVSVPATAQPSKLSDQKEKRDPSTDLAIDTSSLRALASRAVIAVPRAYSESQRAAFMRVLALTGITSVRVVNEVICACLCYGLEKSQPVAATASPAPGAAGAASNPTATVAPSNIAVVDIGFTRSLVAVVTVDDGLFEHRADAQTVFGTGSAAVINYLVDYCLRTAVNQQTSSGTAPTSASGVDSQPTATNSNGGSTGAGGTGGSDTKSSNDSKNVDSSLLASLSSADRLYLFQSCERAVVALSSSPTALVSVQVPIPGAPAVELSTQVLVEACALTLQSVGAALHAALTDRAISVQNVHHV